MSQDKIDPPPDEEGFADLFGPLREGFDPPRAFRDELRESLCAEHTRLYNQESYPPSPASLDSSRAEQSSWAEQTGGAWRRWSFGSAAAATIFLAAILFTWSGADYSWARMIAALSEAEWIQVLAEGQDASSGVGWFSGSQPVVAGRRGGHVFFRDSSGRRQLLRRGESNPIIAAVEGTSAPAGLGDRLVLVLSQMLSSSPGASPPEGFAWRVADQRWQETDGGVIELSVDFELSGAQPSSLRAAFKIDPDSGLPKSVSVSEPDGSTTQELTFQRHETGPLDIYDLGVSQETPVVRATQSELVSLSITRPESRSPSPSPSLAVESERLTVRGGLVVSQDSDRQAATESQRLGTGLLPPHASRRQALAPPLPMEAMVAKIDDLMETHWAREEIIPVGGASEKEFLRRVYLDLAGRIPTVHEATSFFESHNPDRYDALVDELLSQYDHASHQATLWRNFLLGDRSHVTPIEVRSFDRWLTGKFRKNEPYDRLVTDLLLAEGRVEQAGPLVYYAARKLQPEEVARQTSRAFLGIRMDCAQCHDGFFDDRWSQRDFWSFTAFFSQMSSLKSQVERVSPVLRVQDMARGEATLPGTEEVVPPRLPLEETGPPPSEERSRRQILAEWITSSDNEHFSRATVNRVWSHLFGRGLVDPVDDFRPDNNPIAPEVLDTLAEYFVATGYDLRRLTATIARSKAYRLSSEADDEDANRLAHFAQMNVKCLTAEQFYDCVAVATRVKAGQRDVGGLDRIGDGQRAAFVDRFGSHPANATEYEAGMAQALTMMNGSLTSQATDLRSSGLIQSLQAPFFSEEQRVDTLFLATVSRQPTPSERQTVLNFLEKAESDDQRWEVLCDVLWALVNSAEFALIP